MKQVRKEVFQRSDGAQTPGEYNQLFDPLVLADDANLPPSQPFAAPAPPQVVLPSIADAKPQPQSKVVAYYKCVNRGDYASAWGMLPSDLQNNKKIHPQGFSSFQEWMQQIAPVTVTDIRVAEQSSDQALVDLDYRCMIGKKPSAFSLRYSLVWMPAEGGWEIRSVKKR